MDSEIIHEWTRLIMPWPPSLNGYRIPVIRFRKGTRKRFARLITSDDGVAYAYRAQLAILAQRPKKHKGPVAVRIYFHPKKSGSDMDNFKKAMFDALTKSRVWQDDRWVWIDHSEIRRPVPGGAVVIDIRELTEAEIEIGYNEIHESLDGKSYRWM